eukprot:2802691-Pyramimonas_sp.AAC.1
MAKYFAAVQWQPPPLGRALTRGDKLGLVLPLRAGDFSSEKLPAALAMLRTGRASGPESVPQDLWKALGSDADARN